MSVINISNQTYSFNHYLHLAKSRNTSKERHQAAGNLRQRLCWVNEENERDRGRHEELQSTKSPIFPNISRYVQRGSEFYSELQATQMENSRVSNEIVMGHRDSFHNTVIG